MRTTRTVGIAVVALGVTLVLGACASAPRPVAFGQQDAAASAHEFATRDVPQAAPPTPSVVPEAPAVEAAPAQPVPPAPPVPPAEATPAPDPVPPVVPLRTVDGTALPPDPSLVTGQVPAIDAGAVLDSGPYVYDAVGEAAVDRQMAYLFAHWNNYNTARYGDFNAWGGDCQNFVSQSLVARGWTMTPEWYNDWPHNSWSAAWVHVPSFNSWMNRHPYGATPVQFNQRATIKVGDLVVLDWDADGSLDHIQVVSRVQVIDGQIKIAMIGHNTDSDYRDLDTLLNVTYPGAIGWFWSIP